MKLPLRKAALLAIGLTVLAPQAHAQSLSGAYLAARQASMVSDYGEAARYYDRAIKRHPENLQMLQSAVIANLGAGSVDNAARIAKLHMDGGGRNQIADLVLDMKAMQSGNFLPASEPSNDTEGLAPLLNGLVRAWALLGQGQMSNAIAAFGDVARDEDFAPLAYYHEALALAQVGDFEGADEILSGKRHGPLTLSARGIEAQAQVLMQLERTKDATELLTAASAGGFSPELTDLLNRVTSGETIDYSFVTTPQEGAAEVLFTLAAIINGRAAPEHVLIYTRLANYLRPVHAQSSLTTAELLEDLQQYDLAVEAYGQIPQKHPAFFLSEMGRANALYSDERKDAAIEVLTSLSKSYADVAMVHAALGDYLNREERDKEAIAAFTKSIDLRDDSDRGAWRVYYARGIVYERQKNFEGMETDFRKALELQPNQPDVLNYLGYALVEQKIKLDEALGMIETAVAERPESGYIVDSLGWIFYRLGRYDEAVEPMEKAVSLLPVDPIVNDHLGDVYAKVGRIREAEFQWKRALSFDPKEEEADRIRRKLEIGLEAVLQQEAEAGDTQTAND